MARPRNATSVSKLRGSNNPTRDKYRAQEDVIAEELPEIPDPPDWLPNAFAVKEWKRLAPVLTELGLLNHANVNAFGALCAVQGKLMHVFSLGESPNAQLLSQYRSLINDFGLTPAAMSRMNKEPLKNAQQKTNKFATNTRKR